MKKSFKLTVLTILAACCVALMIPASNLILSANTDENEYYVCLSTEKYRITDANKMDQVGDEYILENIALSNATKFYVSDLNGTKYYAKNGEEFKVEETGEYRYIIKFNPDAVYDTAADGYQKTDAHVTYKFFQPDSVSVKIDDNDQLMQYNNYQTAYDLYYISQIQLTQDQVVKCADDSEPYTVPSDGYYRILYTPGKTVKGKTFLFNQDGVYGTDVNEDDNEYIYHLYVEKMPEYYVAFVNDELTESASTVDIKGEKAFLLTRYENNVEMAEYRGVEFFAPNTKYLYKYRIYNKLPNQEYQLIDDDNNEDTTFSKIEVKNVGWDQLALVETNAGYQTSLVEKTYDFAGWYLINNLNQWGFTAQGELNLDDNYQFALIEENEDDYNADYDQYRLKLIVTEKDLKDGNVECYISNGKTKYMNLNNYIVINKAGTYEIKFAENHVYSNGRNYDYYLVDETAEHQEIKISSVEDYLKFARACNASAECSENTEVYLTTDLDFAQTEFISINIFSGTFHGGYHTMKNITSTPNNYNFFGTVTTDAVVERLIVDNLKIAEKDQNYLGLVGKNFGTLNDITVNGTIKGSQFVGAVAAYNGRTKVNQNSATDTYVDGVIKNCQANVTVEGFINVGGICGFSDGQILNCRNNGQITGASYQVNTTPVNLGGIVGYSSGRIVECENFGKVLSNGSSMNVGGIAGLCTGDIYYAFNRANICGIKYVGGVVGYYGQVSQNNGDLQDYFGGVSFEDYVNYFAPKKNNDETTFEQIDGRTHMIAYAVNNGEVKAKGYAGGIVGFTEIEFEIKNTVSDGDIFVTTGNYAGGIVGFGLNITVRGALSAGTVSAKGVDVGKYVGGIVGSGKNIYASMSSATLVGNDLIGGIAGEITGEAKANYTNVLIIANKDAEKYGAIAGSASSYNEATAGFDGKIADNYYVGLVGGIGQTEYSGNSKDCAATCIDSADLANEGVLSPKLSKGFHNEYWIGGKDRATYPVLNYLVNVQTITEYQDDDAFEKIFANYPEFATYAEDYARVTYVVAFLEWNKDNGDLYDDDGALQKDNFELIDSVRIYQGESLTKVPVFKYAEEKNGYNLYEGNRAHYFVNFNIPEQVTENLNIYADYTEIANSLQDAEHKIFVEGLFDAQTQVTLKQGPLGYYLAFTLHDQPINIDKYTVKFFIGDDVKDYHVTLSASNTKLASEVSGQYIKFDLTGDQTFLVKKNAQTSLPNWAWLVIGVAGGAVVTVVIALIVKKTCKKINFCYKITKRIED